MAGWGRGGGSSNTYDKHFAPNVLFHTQWWPQPRGNVASKIISLTQKYFHAKKKGFTVVLPRLVEKWRFGADVSN